MHIKEFIIGTCYLAFYLFLVSRRVIFLNLQLVWISFSSKLFVFFLSFWIRLAFLSVSCDLPFCDVFRMHIRSIKRKTKRVKRLS